MEGFYKPCQRTPGPTGNRIPKPNQPQYGAGSWLYTRKWSFVRSRNSSPTQSQRLRCRKPIKRLQGGPTKHRKREKEIEKQNEKRRAFTCDLEINQGISTMISSWIRLVLQGCSSPSSWSLFLTTYIVYQSCIYNLLV